MFGHGFAAVGDEGGGEGVVAREHKTTVTFLLHDASGCAVTNDCRDLQIHQRGGIVHPNQAVEPGGGVAEEVQGPVGNRSRTRWDTAAEHPLRDESRVRDIVV